MQAVRRKFSAYPLAHGVDIHYELSIQYSVHERISGFVRVRKPETGNFVVGVVSVDLHGVDGQVGKECSGQTYQIHGLTSTVWVGL